MGVEKAVENFTEYNLLKENLFVVILGTVDVLGSEQTHSSLLSPKEDEDKASGEGFLEAEKTETLLEECLAIYSLRLSSRMNSFTSSKTGSGEKF